MKAVFYVVFIGMMMFFGCKKTGTKDNEPKSDEPANILNDNAFIVDSSNVLASLDNSFTLKKGANIRQPNIGEIVLAVPSSKCPFGMLRKVTALTTHANSVDYTTEQSNLNDAFKELHIDVKYTDTFSGSQTFARGTSLNLDFQNNLSIGNGVKLNGNITFDYPTLEIKYEKEKGSGYPKFILIKAELNSESQGIELTNSGSSAYSYQKKIIKTFDNLPTVKFIIPIGGFPFPLLLKQKVDISCLPFELNGKFKFAVNSNFNAVLGFKFENSAWQNISTYSIGASSPTKFTFADYVANGTAVNAQLTFLNPRYTITPMYVDILQGTLEAPNKLVLSIKNTQPNYSLKYQLDAEGALSQTFWLGGVGSFSLSGNVIEKTLLEGNWDSYKLEYVSGNGQSYIGGGMLLPMIFKIKNTASNAYVTNLAGSDLSLTASANIGYQDASFSNLSNYCGTNSTQCFGGYYYIPANTGQPFALNITVSLKQNGILIDTYNIVQNIK